MSKSWYAPCTGMLPANILEMVCSLTRYQLDLLEEEIASRRRELMAACLEANGFRALTSYDGNVFPFVCVCPPEDATPHPDYCGWATLEECQRLLDTVANLPPAEAFTRWSAKVAPIESEPYTRDDAIADMKRERCLARAAYEAGEIDGGEYAERWKATHDLLTLVEKKR